jgi:hypothetical protein
MKEILLQRSPDIDPNYQSFVRDVQADTFPENEFVAYQDGILIGQGTNREKLIQLLSESSGPIFLTQVRGHEEVLDIPTPFEIES